MAPPFDRMEGWCWALLEKDTVHRAAAFPNNPRNCQNSQLENTAHSHTAQSIALMPTTQPSTIQPIHLTPGTLHLSQCIPPHPTRNPPQHIQSSPSIPSSDPQYQHTPELHLPDTILIPSQPHGLPFPSTLHSNRTPMPPPIPTPLDADTSTHLWHTCRPSCLLPQLCMARSYLQQKQKCWKDRRYNDHTK